MPEQAAGGTEQARKRGELGWLDAAVVEVEEAVDSTASSTSTTAASSHPSSPRFRACSVPPAACSGMAAGSAARCSRRRPAWPPQTSAVAGSTAGRVTSRQPHRPRGCEVGRRRAIDIPGNFLRVQGGLTRRSFVERAGLTGLAAALGQLPALLDAKGLLAEALAQSGDVTEDTLSGLIAFILPGDDEYSRAQGDNTKEPGGIAAGTLPVFIRNLDAFVPVAVPGAGTETLPASGGVAMLLNRYATEVNPAAANGEFAAPFARLSNAEKAEVFKRFESDTAWDGTEFKFVSGILFGFVAFL